MASVNHSHARNKKTTTALAIVSREEKCSSAATGFGSSTRGSYKTFHGQHTNGGSMWKYNEVQKRGNMVQLIGLYGCVSKNVRCRLFVTVYNVQCTCHSAAGRTRRRCIAIGNRLNIYNL